MKGIMTIDALITKLKRERDRLDTAIEVLEESSRSRSDKKKRRDIINKLKSKKKGKHWTQTPAGRKKMKEIGKVNIPHSAFMEVLKT